VHLRRFVELLTDEKASELFGKKPRTMQSWRLGARYPTRTEAKEIIIITRDHPIGSVTSFDEIYGPLIVEDSQGAA